MNGLCYLPSCDVSVGPFLPCPDCQVAQYCSITCMAQHEMDHARNCKIAEILRKLNRNIIQFQKIGQLKEDPRIADSRKLYDDPKLYANFGCLIFSSTPTRDEMRENFISKNPKTPDELAALMKEHGRLPGFIEREEKSKDSFVLVEDTRMSTEAIGVLRICPNDSLRFLLPEIALSIREILFTGIKGLISGMSQLGYAKSEKICEGDLIAYIGPKGKATHFAKVTKAGGKVDVVRVVSRLSVDSPVFEHDLPSVPYTYGVGYFVFTRDVFRSRSAQI